MGRGLYEDCDVHVSTPCSIHVNNNYLTCWVVAITSRKIRTEVILETSENGSRFFFLIQFYGKISQRVAAGDAVFKVVFNFEVNLRVMVEHSVRMREQIGFEMYVLFIYIRAFGEK